MKHLQVLKIKCKEKIKKGIEKGGKKGWWEGEKERKTVIDSGRCLKQLLHSLVWLVDFASLVRS